MRTEFDAYVADARETYALYETMATEQLLTLRNAFEMDTADATAPETIAFGAGRLALIAAVLKTRSTRNSPPLGGLAETHGGD